MTTSAGEEWVEVVARFGSDGELTPQSFTWHGRRYKVDITDRRWQDDSGQHFLVMVPGELVYELTFSPVELRWRIKPSGRLWV